MPVDRRLGRHVVHTLIRERTPEILPFRRDGESGVMEFVAARCPDFLIIFPAWFPRLATRQNLLVPIYRVRLERVEVSGGPEMVVYRLARGAV